MERNLGLKVIHGYYGSNLTSLVKERFAQNKPTMFYWWEPDPTPPQVGEDVPYWPGVVWAGPGTPV